MLLVTAALMLAGCTHEGETDEGPAPSDGPGPTPLPGSDQVDPPVWSLTDWWTYKTTDGETTTLVVTEDSGSDWVIGTDSESLAFFHAREEVSTMGAQRKSDLAGSQESDRIAFFKWPLTDGDNWTTRWDGVERRITTTAEADGRFTFEATEEGTPVVRYSYDPTAEWFGNLDFLGPDGTVAFGWTLEDHGTGWTGNTIQVDLQTIWSFTESNIMSYSIQPDQFEVPESATDVWVTLTIACTSGTLVGGSQPAPWDDPTIGIRWNEACTAPYHVEKSLGKKVGTWTTDLLWQDTQAGGIEGSLYIRTIEKVAIG